MSDQGEKTCPLCAEEMDLTDQQLKPCKCGYEICVWCWHHIMDMAEKDDTEGRCPACRAPYDKEKIVGMTASCERLVAEISTERKMKSLKTKNKPSEVKKQQLSSVRVIQRNLVYIVGLPLNLGDEDLLQCKEYFGQYGKVLKVSMSRTAAGVIQQFPNSTCSVYITYSKEEEAVRCIQSVHGFVLDGRSLKACFGTTKYCHAWLRNVPCSNPDCLYLHEIGSQEDSFTKDEIISAYTRSRVQQITGTTNNLQRRSGNSLPPPFDDYWPNSSASVAKPIVQNVSNNTQPIATKDSSPNGSSGRPVALPAAASWGMRVLNQQPFAASASSNGPTKQKPDTVGGTLTFSSAVENTSPVTALHDDALKKPILNEDGQVMYAKGKLDLLKPLRQHIGVDCQTSAEIASTPNGDQAVNLSSQSSCPPLIKFNDKSLSMPLKGINSIDNNEQSHVSSPDKGDIATDVKMQNLCSDMSAINIDRNIVNENSGVFRPSNLLPDNGTINMPGNQGLQQYYGDQSREPSMSPTIGKSVTSTNEVFLSREKFGLRADSQTQVVLDASPQEEEDVLSFDNQRLKDPEVVCRSYYYPNSANSFHVPILSRSHSLQHSEAFSNLNLNTDSHIVDNKVSNGLHRHSSSTSVMSVGYPEKSVWNSAGSDRAVEPSLLLSSEGKGNPMGGLQCDADNRAATDKGENSIISNILSMDFNTWDESLALPQNLVKLLGENDREPSSMTMSSSRKVQNNNQSRFSFARQEELRNQTFDGEQSFNVFGQLSKNHCLSQDFVNRDPLEKLGNRNGFYPGSFEESDNFSSNPYVFSSNKHSVSRSQISAPPGFSIPSRAPPPGFSSHERVDQSFDTMSGNHLLDSSSLLRNSYQTQPAGNMNATGDIEFMDPAILAVGKGRLQGGLNNPGLDMRSNFPSQLNNAFENEARLQLMMQRSLSPHQNLKYPDIGDNFSSLGDSYGISSRLMDQSHASNLSPFAQLSIQQSRNSMLSNGHHWDGWNEVQGANGIGMAEFLRNERLGINKFYTGYEDSKFRMPSSGDIYNRTFGM